MKFLNTFFNIFLFSSLLAFSRGNVTAQTVKGYVYGSRANGGQEALPMATVYWMDGNQVVQTDNRGFFTINRRANTSRFLIASFVGFVADTLEVTDFSTEMVFTLKTHNELDAAIVTARQQGTLLSRNSAIRTEVITTAGLQKMACCNLAESFENSASVSVGYTDAVTGARQIRLLGLSGIYIQMSDENRPSLRGLLSPFGLGFVPGPWLEGIQVAKGPGSVVNGYEAITGQINMEYRKPTVEQPLFVNLSITDALCTEANIASSLQLNQKWNTVLLGHFSAHSKPMDSNHDGFLDMPLSLQYNFANRWLYASDKGIQWRFGFRALQETREAGQNSHISTHASNVPLWKSTIKNKGINLYSKLAIPLKKPGTETSAVAPNMALVVDYTHHALDSYFGTEDKYYNALENLAFANLMLQFGIKEEHRFNLGLSGRYDAIHEELSALYTHPDLVRSGVNPFSFLGRKEHSFGAYGEYTYNQQNKFLFVLGTRLDYNNLYGWLFTPRVNVKYDLTENLIFRASGGKGYRTLNLIADNLGVLSTGRWTRFDNELDMEQAWTYGLNLTGYFRLGWGEKSSLSLDYFRTDFTKQVLVDQERDLDYVWFYNLDGPSYTNTFQVDLTLEPIERFSILTTFRYTDVQVHIAELGTVERPLMSRFKGVFNVQYATRMRKWVFDVTAQLNGPSRLPYFANAVPVTPHSDQFKSEYSPVYPVFYAQLTRRFRNLDIYVGGENLLSYMQPHPIIEAENPFSHDFNASVVWGPLMGCKIYAGIRFTLFK
ncbi:MAG: TonB-dependent receptor [Prevotellaceae bacterium]|jgi:hypothetical protein|nr:TonB-dependent receptor [Prevotellaceae bacterium]